jgi:tetratricopeptide (TPR) repeat protein
MSHFCKSLPIIMRFDGFIPRQTWCKLGALALALLCCWGCGGPRSPFGKQVDKVEKFTKRGDEWYSQGDLSRAEREFQRALSLSRGMDYQPGVARQLNNLGAVALEQGNLRQARELFDRAWEVNRSQGNWAEASANQANLATVAHQQKDLEGVVLHLSQAETAARHSKDKGALARIYARWADFSLHQQDFSRAEAYLKLAQPLARTPALKAAVAHQQGRLALARGDAGGAISHLIRALEWDREVQDRAAMAADLYYLGEACRLGRDWPRAFDYYARAFDVYASLNRRARVQDCLARLKEANREGALNRPLDRFEKPNKVS